MPGPSWSLAQNAEYATEVTLQPLARFPLDAAILLSSSIPTVPHAMGLGLDFRAGEGPHFERPVRTEADVDALALPDLDRLRYVFDAVALIRRELNGRVPLIGFAGSPWTIACYMVEGKGSDDYRLIKGMAYGRPDLMHRILRVNAQATIDYLNAQIAAGAQAVMLFDSWGGVLADGLFQAYSLAYTRQVLAGLIREREGRRIPAIVLHQGRRDVAGGYRRLWRGRGGRGLDGEPASGPPAGRRARRRCKATWIRWCYSAVRRLVRAEARRVIDDFGVVGTGAGTCSTWAMGFPNSLHRMP